MNEAPAVSLEPPRFEESKPRLIAGLRNSYLFAAPDVQQGIIAQWQRLGPLIGRIPGQIGAAAYGVAFDMFGDKTSFDYLAGVEVSATSPLLDGFCRVELPALTWAAFPHRRHASKFNETMHAIMHTWLPTSDFELARGNGAPDLLERYGEEFDPQSGMGGMELWIPIKRR